MRFGSPLAFVRELLGRTFYWVPGAPRRVQIEVTNFCNLTCRMCPRELYDLELTHLDLDAFDRVLAAMPASVRRVILVGWGESLLHPGIFEMIRRVQASGREAQLTSNALLLKGDHVARLLETPPDYLAFSVDSLEDGGDGHPLSVALDRIRQVLAARQPGKPPYVSFQTTIHRDGEADVLRVVQLAADLGVERVALIRLDTRYVPGLLRPALAEEERIVDAAYAVGRRLGVQVDFVYGFGRGLVRRAYRLLRPWMYRRDYYCPKTYDYLYVNNQGKVTPCCALPRYEVGDVEEGLGKIWRGKAMEHFRENQEAICGGCDFNTVRYRHTEGVLLDPAQSARGVPVEADEAVQLDLGDRLQEAFVLPDGDVEAEGRNREAGDA